MESTQTITNETLEGLKQQILGKVLSGGDEDYDKARAVYNGMIDKHPAVIVQCLNAEDVIAAVNFARNNGLLLAIKGGGHSGPGFGICDGGLVIDLSPMKDIQVNPENRTVRVGAGCRWGEVDEATNAFGLATVSGVIANTGVGGLTLSGGHGYLSRKYGLTIDNLLEAEVVLADGSKVLANKDENKDLFWALRGGGGNFGVVTSFVFQLHPLGMVIGGPMLWATEEIETTLRWYRDWLPQAPKDIYAFYQIAKIPPAPIFPESLHGKNACGLMWCCSGTPEQAEVALQEARNVAKPLFEYVGPVPYPILQSMFDPLLPPGLQWYWKGDLVRELSDEAIEVHKRFSDTPSALSTMHMYPVNGAVHDIDKSDTAWSFRDVNWSMVIGGIDPEPENAERISTWAKDYWEAFHPHSAGAAYLNFIMEEGDGRIRAAFRDNYERLQKIKTKYDPENLFKVNQNIKPQKV